jgi:hypothetical protein
MKNKNLLIGGAVVLLGFLWYRNRQKKMLLAQQVATDTRDADEGLGGGGGGGFGGGGSTSPVVAPIVVAPDLISRVAEQIKGSVAPIPVATPTTITNPTINPVVASKPSPTPTPTSIPTTTTTTPTSTSSFLGFSGKYQNATGHFFDGNME